MHNYVGVEELLAKSVEDCQRKFNVNCCGMCFCRNTGRTCFHLTATSASIAAVCHSLSCRMSVFHLALSWTSICQLLAVLAAAPVALLTFWTAKLLVRHAWYTHRMACFSKPHAHSWLLGHLGQVTLRQMEVSQFLICKTTYRM